MTTDPIPNSFEAVLRHQRKGKMLSELSNSLQAAVLAVVEHGEPATVTLTLKVTPANGDATAMSVQDEIKSKLPQPRKPNTLFFSTDDGRLVREDPHQKEMSFEVAADNTNTEPPALTATSA